MMTSLYEDIFSSGRNELLLNFKAGYFTGVVLVVFILLLWAACRMVFARKARRRIREIVIPGAKGDLIVSLAAISDLVKSVVYEKFKHFVVDKVVVWKTKQGLVMELKGSFRRDGDHLPDVSNEMREEILTSLEDKFGINSIGKINCRV